MVEGDIEGDLDDAVRGVDAVYYLVHSIGESPDWAEREVAGAANLRDAAAAAGVQRIVYLGGLGTDHDAELSPHLRSRHAVGEVLADGPVSVTELRAAVIIGSGSASFEMLRYLVEVLPGDGHAEAGSTRDASRSLCARRAAISGRRARRHRRGRRSCVSRSAVPTSSDVPRDDGRSMPRRHTSGPVLVDAGPRCSHLGCPRCGSASSRHCRVRWRGRSSDSLVNEVVAVHDDSILDVCPGPRIGYRAAVRLAPCSANQ